ncbi:MAG: hypothetical protein ABSF55_00080 [Candidatus Staskawiczbacteria bacterium]|jgi:hypothetical protein
MKQIADGLYAVVEGMPCSPDQLKIVPHSCPGALGRAEIEEVAARVLHFSMENGRWVGVTWRKLVAQLITEHDADQKLAVANSHNFEEYLRVQKARENYYALCVLTLGLYALFVSRPEPNLMPVPQVDLPLSLVPIKGPDFIPEAIRTLLDSGLLRQGKNNGDEVLFPTSHLVNKIMAAQAA